jgi:hypothetical protein
MDSIYKIAPTVLPLNKKLLILPFVYSFVKFWSENLNRKDHLKEIGVDERIRLKWIIEK